MSTENSLREKYKSGEIFKIGSIVEDVLNTKYKILDRGSNYLTLQSDAGQVSRKWLHDVSEVVEEVPVVESAPVAQNADFVEISGQIKMFGYETKNFDTDLSTFMIEQFSEFSDTYSKHQIVKLIDSSLQESNLDLQYAILEKVTEFCSKQNITEPFIVEAVRNEIERKRIAEMIASIAGSQVNKSYFKTVSDAIEVLKEKYKTKMQWIVIAPVFKLAQEYGITGMLAKLPYNLGSAVMAEDIEVDTILDVFYENIDTLVDELDIDTILESFDEDEFSDADLTEEQINEVLSIQSRHKLGIDMKKHESRLGAKRARALKVAGNSEVLASRARKLALNLVKTRMFKKPASELTRQEKERFEAGAAKRKDLIARLSQKLISKVRMIQNTRLHNTPHHGHKQVDVALKQIGAS